MSLDANGWWHAAGPLYGGWCTIPGSFAAEVMGSAGFDWCCIDLQHGMLDRSSALAMLQGLAATAAPGLVRVSRNEGSEIMWALDAGAAGVIVPLVNDPESARAAVAACRYPPTGSRSWGPTRSALTAPSPVPVGAGSALCIVMIETVEAVQRLEEILAVPGIDGVFVGPSDLGLSVGVDPRESRHPARDELVTRIIEGCRAAEVPVGVFCTELERATTYRAAGAHFLVVQSDVRLLRDAARTALSELRQDAAPS